MKFVKLMLAGATAIVALATAAHAATIFEGRFVVTSATGCAATDIGQRFTGYYQIANLGTNPNKSVLTLVSDLDADGYQVTGLFGTAFQAAIGLDTSSGVATPFAAQIKVSSGPTPGATTVATNFISMLVQIRNRGNDPGGIACTVAMRGAFVRR